MKNPLLTLAVVVAAGGTAACAPSIQLEVLQPSLITSPPEIRTLAVVDRSRAKNFGQGVLGAIEGVLTGEAIGADNEGRAQAMMAMVDTLRSSPRFEAVEPFVPKKEMESSLWDKEMSWSTAKKICKSAGCQGIVSLEALDSDSRVDIDVTEREVDGEDGKKRIERTYNAQRTTDVVTAWRYYDVVNKQIIDDVRGYDSSYSWTESGSTASAARGRLVDQRYSVGHVGAIAGEAYARRIAPTPIMVSRSYYASGDDTLKLAKNYVKALDWAGATDLWDGLFKNSPDPKIRGKAAYNLALASEVHGDLRNAASWATEAAVLLANGKARRYRVLLDRRLADQERLAEQMRMAAPGTIEDERRPLAVPREKAPLPSRVGGDKKPSTPPDSNRGGSTGTTGGNR